MPIYRKKHQTAHGVDITEHKLNKKRVLVVDDTALNSKITIKQLDRYEITADVAENGKLAVEAFCGSPEGLYSAIITDISMPVMNGYEEASKIRGSSHPQAKTIPIIAHTSNNRPEDIKQCFSCGMNAYLPKPLNVQMLYCLLDKYIK